MSELPLPSHFDPGQVPTLYLERAAEVFAAAKAYAKQHSLRPASEDRPRSAVFIIDAQISFCMPGASLFVPGAVEDLQRAIRWLYKNLDQLTGIFCSLNTHLAYQIFHPSWWVDERGEPPAPYTCITYEQVRSGRFRAVRYPEESLEYTRKLEGSGKYVLTLWPFHALLGSPSHSLMPALFEAVLFHAFSRQASPHIEVKGAHPLTENYSVFQPEVTELSGRTLGGFNQALFEKLMSFDRVYVFGEASSHCVLETLKDLNERIQATEPANARKVWILTDAMSPVRPPPQRPLPESLDFPRVVKKAFAKLQEAGMHLTDTAQPLF